VIPRISLRQALADPALLGGVLEGESWKPWRALLIAAMGGDLTQDERLVFKKFTGRDREPGRRVEEFVGIKGRRAGGSYAGGKVVIPYLAGLCQPQSTTRTKKGCHRGRRIDPHRRLPYAARRYLLARPRTGPLCSL